MSVLKGIFGSSGKVKQASVLSKGQKQQQQQWGNTLNQLRTDYDPSATPEQTQALSFLKGYTPYARQQLGNQRQGYDQALRQIWDPNQAQQQIMTNYQQNIMPQFENTYLPKALEAANKYVGGGTGAHSAFDNTIAREYGNIYHNMASDASNVWQQYHNNMNQGLAGSQGTYRTAIQGLLGNEPTMQQQVAAQSRALVDQGIGAMSPYLRAVQPYMNVKSRENIVTPSTAGILGGLGQMAGTYGGIKLAGL